MKDWPARWCGCHVMLILSRLQRSGLLGEARGWNEANPRNRTIMPQRGSLPLAPYPHRRPVELARGVLA